MTKFVEVAPGRWRVARETSPVARSNLPLPYVISDIMPETEQVDGKFYTSKRQFRAAGKALGLVEVGTEKPKPKTRASEDPAWRKTRQKTIKTAIEKVRAGYHERHFTSTGTRRTSTGGSGSG